MWRLWWRAHSSYPKPSQHFGNVRSGYGTIRRIVGSNVNNVHLKSREDDQWSESETHRGDGLATTISLDQIWARQRKARPDSKCFDCGEPGHWAGDPQCKRPKSGRSRATHVAEHVNQTDVVLHTQSGLGLAESVILNGQVEPDQLLTMAPEGDGALQHSGVEHHTYVAGHESERVTEPSSARSRKGRFREANSRWNLAKLLRHPLAFPEDFRQQNQSPEGDGLPEEEAIQDALP